MKLRRKSAMGRRLQAIADAPGMIDGMHINAWIEGENGEVRSEAGRQVSIQYHRADGKPRLTAQKGKAW